MLSTNSFVFGATVKFSSDSLVRLRPTVPFGLTSAEAPLALLYHNPLSHPTFTGRRVDIERIGGYSDSLVAQDYELWLRAAAAGVAVAKTGLPLLGYRVGLHQVSKSADFRIKVENSVKLRASYFQLLSIQLPELAVLTKKVRDGQPVSSEDRAELKLCLARASTRMTTRTKRAYYSKLADSNRMDWPF